jgi:SIR2-like domain
LFRDELPPDSDSMIDNELRKRLAESIEADRLVILAGAGLSMANPSKVPSAAQLATQNAERYRAIVSEDLPAAARGDLAAQALYFMRAGNLINFFLDRLIQWDPFYQAPNKGHKALADLLWSGATEVVVTTNVDNLIEASSLQLGGKLMSSLNLDEATRRRGHSPFVKLHGCAERDRDNTVWCKEQLDANPKDDIARNVESLITWLRANLHGKDLVFIGFWSDWAYLNEILESALADATPPLVGLVDPADDGALKAKAPHLWEWAAQQNFVTIKASGADFLDELGALFSRNFINRLVATSSEAHSALFGATEGDPPKVPDTVAPDDLYSFRRNAAGLPSTRLATEKRPSPQTSAMGAILRFLFSRGVELEGDRFVLRGERIRVITMRSIYRLSALATSTFRRDFVRSFAIEDERTFCFGFGPEVVEISLANAQWKKVV